MCTYQVEYFPHLTVITIRGLEHHTVASCGFIGEENGRGAGLNFGGKSEANPGSRVRVVGNPAGQNPLAASGRKHAAVGGERRFRGGLLSGGPFEAARHSFPLRQVSQPPCLQVCHEIFKSGTKWEVSRRQLGCKLDSFRTAPFT
jgi:hypothetical protein